MRKGEVLMIDRINKLLANPGLSAGNKKALMDMQAQYRNLGGDSTPSIGSQFGKSLETSAASAIDNKVRQALGLGVRKEDIDRVMKNNALKARDQKIRAALLSGGLSGANKAAANQAGLITQAGLDNRSFTPQSGALDPVGEGYEQAAQAEATAAKQIQGIDEAKIKEAEKKATDLDEKEATGKEAIRLASEAKFLVQPAAKAGDYINGFTKFSDDEEKSIADQVGNLVTSTVNVVAGAFDQTRRVREEARERLVASKFPDSYRAYTRLRTLANQMVFPILESGSLGVNPTDADVDLARKATFDVSSPSDTWMVQLNDIIAKAQGKSFAKSIVAKLPKKEGAPKVEVPVTNNNKTNTVTDKVTDIFNWK